MIPDHKLYAVASQDALVLGVLSSTAHQAWALAAGGRLGVGNDPTWTNTSTFLPFPFPALPPDSPLAERIRTLGEQLDGHRKGRQALHPGLTLTGLYNVLEKLRSGEPLTAKERTIHDHGLVSVLRQLHDDLDRAVLEAYGWTDLAEAFAAAPTPETRETLRQELLQRLATLNAQRAAEEKTGLIRWLRPDFQARQPDLPLEPSPEPEPEPEPATPAAKKRPRKGAAAKPKAEKPQTLPWPAELPVQAATVLRLLKTHPQGLTPDQLAAHFTKAPQASLLTLLETLVALGQAVRDRDVFSASP